MRGSNPCDGPQVKITEVHFVNASNADVERGLLGWTSCVINDALRIDGITVRRTLSGDITVSFPARTDGWGQKHSILRPLNDRVRRELEHQILRALGLEEGTPR